MGRPGEMRVNKSAFVDCPPSRVLRYGGIKPPRCSGGMGCDLCWDKFNRLRRQAVLVPVGRR